MIKMSDFSKPRVNGKMLPSFQGRSVCVLGNAKDVDSNGTAFTLSTSDGQDIRIIMQEPLGEYVSGLTEVHGNVDAQNNIHCLNYIAFPKEISDTFDMGLYNDAVELTSRFSEFYKVGVTDQ
ncbi:replication protein A 14 kDa subunit-like [Saccostrea echinata]|uniref:replication protein A 14 kDa subunit-like n=1 Tax=Saccostrea echinata TaxID=191078 RepID=UPI002A7FFB4F|nr:replication protein A 14 kDa subunit-like [Saccostrea echinata]